MRKNEYNNLNEFIYEYDSGRHSSIDDNHGRKFIGIEFKYKNIYYRMCREPKTYKPYQVSIMHCDKFGYPIADEFEIVGSYNDIYDLLDNCIIDNEYFKVVIMDDSTEILSQD